MKLTSILSWFCLLIMSTTVLNAQTVRRLSPGKTTYYIDPVAGNDAAKGTRIDRPWKTFKHLNQVQLLAGDRVEIRPGAFHESLLINGKGSKEAPVEIRFAPGRYDFYREGAFKQKMHISNTNNDPEGLKAIAIYLKGAKYINVHGKGAALFMRGKMIETCIDSCENISITGLSYDYHRPTVSELTVLQVGEGYADVRIHKDSKYSIADSVLTWEGEGWRVTPGYLWQKLDPVTNEVHRLEFAVKSMRYAELGDHQVRIFFAAGAGKSRFEAGKVYQNRDIIRDCTGIFVQRSKQIFWKDIRLNYMHGMGVVSQFCEDIKMDGISVRPAEGSRRTCAAWADILHFAGCKGKIEVSNSYLSAANDDAINVHGLHLRIVELPAPNQVKVRFMHPETFGFDAFTVGDSIDFIRVNGLNSYASNVVTEARMISDKDILLTLKDPAPANIEANDVIENVTWTPEVWIHNNVIARIPTRGILTSSRRKTVIEDNELQRTHMSGILVADDAGSWYESGMVKDLTIRNNKFSHCGSPAILIEPMGGPNTVHSGIKVLNNKFDLREPRLLYARSTADLRISGNVIRIADPQKTVEQLLEIENCSEVKVEGNKVKPISR